MKKNYQTNYTSPSVEVIEMEIEDAILVDSPTGNNANTSDFEQGTGRYDAPANNQVIW